MKTLLKSSIFARCFELDLRSLAVARIALGFLVFLDCIFRLTNFSAHYTEFGVLPLEALQKLYRPTGPCLHCLDASTSWAGFLFFLQAIAGLTLMMGWKTRISTFMCWLLTVSVQYRNPLIIDGGDVLLRCFLVWTFFLPMGEHFSLDSKNKMQKATTFYHWFNLSLPLQLFALYFMSALLKTGDDWWPLGTASGYALSLDAFVTPFGKWLTGFPEALKLATRFVYLMELWAPFLLLLGGYYRLAGVLVFFGLHIGLGLAMDLALFPWIAFACLFSVMPKEFWDFLGKKYTSIAQHVLEYKNSRIQNASLALAVPLFAVAISWNIATYIKKPLPKHVRKVGHWAHVDQYWGMFAPFPLKDAGWYEFGMTLWNGEYVYGFVNDTMEYYWDENKGEPIQANKYFSDQRWRKYLVNLWEKNNSRFRPALAAYLCRKWNKDFDTPSDKAVKVDIEFKLFQNREYLVRTREPANINLGSYDCQTE